MKKSILASFTLLAVAGLSVLSPKNAPLPYHFQEVGEKGEDVLKAQVLIVGDRLGLHFDKFVPELTEKVSVTLASDLRIMNWSAPGEGLHRTLGKISSLEKIPPVVIYHGGSEEFFERRFSLNDLTALQTNLSREIPPALRFLPAPLLAGIFYRSYSEPVSLPKEPLEDKQTMEGLAKLQYREQVYRLFDYEFGRLVKEVSAHNSTLIVITTPTNIMREHKAVCPKTTTVTLERTLDELETAVKKGQTQRALTDIPKFLKLSPTHARLHYILGRAWLAKGDVIRAKEALDKASIFDCTLWRGNLVFNKIMIDHAREKNTVLIDFHEEIHALLGKGSLFLDAIHPRDMFYKALVRRLADLVQSSMNL